MTKLWWPFSDTASFRGMLYRKCHFFFFVGIAFFSLWNAFVFQQRISAKCICRSKALIRRLQFLCNRFEKIKRIYGKTKRLAINSFFKHKFSFQLHLTSDLDSKTMLLIGSKAWVFITSHVNLERKDFYRNCFDSLVLPGNFPVRKSFEQVTNSMVLLNSHWPLFDWVFSTTIAFGNPHCAPHLLYGLLIILCRTAHRLIAPYLFSRSIVNGAFCKTGFTCNIGNID